MYLEKSRSEWLICRLCIVLFLIQSQNTSQRRGEELCILNCIFLCSHSFFHLAHRTVLLMLHINFLCEEICPKEWNLSRNIPSFHLQQLALPLCERAQCPRGVPSWQPQTGATELPLSKLQAWERAQCCAEPRARHEDVWLIPWLWHLLGNAGDSKAGTTCEPRRRHLFAWHWRELPVCSWQSKWTVCQTAFPA